MSPVFGWMLWITERSERHITSNEKRLTAFFPMQNYTNPKSLGTRARWTHQVLHHTHPLAAQFSHQTVHVHEIVVTDVLNEVVKGDKHSGPAYTSTRGMGQTQVTVYQVMYTIWYKLSLKSCSSSCLYIDWLNIFYYVYPKLWMQLRWCADVPRPFLKGTMVRVVCSAAVKISRSCLRVF